VPDLFPDARKQRSDPRRNEVELVENFSLATARGHGRCRLEEREHSASSPASEATPRGQRASREECLSSIQSQESIEWRKATR
jgi:hypothetical protein